MKIYVDENISPYLAKGFHELQIPNNKKNGHSFEVLSIKEVFGQGVADEVWIPVVGPDKAVIITQDINIQRTRHQRELCEKHGLGMIFIAAPSKKGFSYWEMVKLLVKKWEEITHIAHKEKLPFAYRCTAKGDLVPLSAK
jgi:hypothetical protein